MEEFLSGAGAAVTLMVFCTFILGRRDYKKSKKDGITYADPISEGGPYAKWWIILLLVWVIGLVTLGGSAANFFIILATLVGLHITKPN